MLFDVKPGLGGSVQKHSNFLGDFYDFLLARIG